MIKTNPVRCSRLLPITGVVLVLLTLGAPVSLHATDEDLSNQLRFNLGMHHEIVTNLTGFVHVSYFNDPDTSERTYQLGWPGLVYSAKDWLQFSGGLLTSFVDNNNSANTLELRP